MNAADLLTGLRAALALPFAWILLQRGSGWAWLALLVVGVAIASDLLDGRLARRAGGPSRYGRVFDHTTDVAFVLCGLAALAARDVVPWLLPALVALAFAQYVVDSYWLHRERTLRMSWLGRWNGILYFVPLVGDPLVRTILGWGQPLLAPIAWALVATTSASIADRLLALRRAPRTAPGSP